MLEVLLKALVPIFFVMALGYFAGRRRTIDNHHVREINALVMDFACPRLCSWRPPQLHAAR